MSSNQTHGLSDTPLYAVWNSMMQRCYNASNEVYHCYGGRGITVCDRWHDFLNFKKDMEPRPEGLTLERKDNDGNYEPGNCIWTTRWEQGQNTRSCHIIEHDGVKRTLRGWASALGIRPATIYYRSRKGYSDEEILFGKKRTKP